VGLEQVTANVQTTPIPVATPAARAVRKTMPRLLLLVASTISPERAADARALGLAAVRTLGVGDVLLGRKDAFAAEALALGFRRVAFDLEGARVEDGAAVGAWYDRDKIAPGETVSWPIYRDRALIEAAAKARAAGWDVEALVVHDTHADATVEHFVRTCRELGVPGRTVLPKATDRVDPVGVGADWTDRDLVFIDLETTGLSPARHAIVQIGAVHADPHGRLVRREFKTLVQPWDGADVDDGALAVNGLSRDAWKDAPSAEGGMKLLLAWLPPRFVYANQRASFDRSFVAAACARHKLPEPGWWPARMDRCTQKMAQRLLVDARVTVNAKLHTTCAHFGISNTDEHDALVDARRAREAYVKLKEIEDQMVARTGTED
jgi:DNA polymerase III epsilon subunit-like protein